jgi:hypothetical protein
MANGDVRTACSRISIRMGPGKRAHLPVHETSIPHIGRYHRCPRPQLARAEEHHQAAISIADSTACRVAQPVVRYWYADMLWSRDGVGDWARARQFFGEAVSLYQAAETAWHARYTANRLSNL